jgi:hypothetical protein
MRQNLILVASLLAVVALAHTAISQDDTRLVPVPQQSQATVLPQRERIGPPKEASSATRPAPQAEPRNPTIMERSPSQLRREGIGRAANRRLEPVADTKLLMEALNETNFRGLEKILTQAPADSDAWTFARGQALLIGESANLLMIRPPTASAGRAVWLERADDLRSAAVRLARAAAGQDYTQARANLLSMAQTCNSCHQSFRVALRVVPFAEAGGPQLSPRTPPKPRPPVP